MKKLGIFTKGLALVVALSMAIVFTAGQALAADNYPSKPIQLIVPWKAGGGTDSLFRVVAHYAGKYLGQPMVIVNLPGVCGTMCASKGKDAKP